MKNAYGGQMTSKSFFTLSLGGYMTVIAWLIAIVLLFYFFHHWLQRAENPNQNVQTLVDDKGQSHVKIIKNRWQQYIVSGMINNIAVTFLVDTGATSVSVPSAIAKTLHLQQGMVAKAMTANGMIDVYHTIIPRLQIGSIILYNVRATINPHSDDEVVLLGMSVLQRLDFHQQGDVLTLTAAVVR
jgi:aspartyl protease family protein